MISNNIIRFKLPYRRLEKFKKDTGGASGRIIYLEFREA